jgi:alpha-tubulin suppressor-like RCC1 family protein
MSSKLWEYFIQDDVESFSRYLANATFAGPRASGVSGAAATAATAATLSSKTGSPGSMIPSSPNPTKQRKASAGSPATSVPDRSGFQRGNTALSRADVNTRDHFGRTLLHHIASSPKPTASSFARALLEIPFLDIYAQDWESGWTALHRALYAGNATIARALIARDTRDMTDYSKPGHTSQSGSLIKIKDREGYSPFDVYGSTITSRDIKQVSSTRWLESLASDIEGSDAASNPGSHYGEEGEDDAYIARSVLKSRTDFAADEVFTLGSNKNLNLGLGDQDDRQFPERIVLKRPDHLLNRFYREYEEQMEKLGLEDLLDHGNSNELPTVIKNKPMKLQNVVMSKLHTAVITDDPEANLFICGFGPGGRLGTGDESTRFNFVCIETGGLAGRKVMSVALGQDHSLAITEFGEIFSWGSNKFGQLGYSLPRTSNKNDVPIQSTPRQIFNPFKKETILGAAASSIHSVVFSNSGLYTFGKNEGQLGLVDSDARSLEVQTTPRRVGASLFKCPVQMVSAIDRATAVLLQNHEVWVFSQYGYSKISFPLEATSRFIRDSFMATRYDSSVNHVVKLACGGNTICALSSSGDVFTVHVNKSEDPSAQTSTTNPAKIRNSLAAPERAWSVKKSHMAASDVDVGQDGSIIICTTSGSAFRKEKRTKNKEGVSKDYKFARIPGLSRAVAVRSNAFGAYAVAQRDCDVTREQIHIDESTLWDDILPLSPFITPSFDDVEAILDEDATDNPMPLSSAMAIKRTIIQSSEFESQFLSIRSEGTIWVTSSLSDARIPVHEFLLAGRSPVLRKALQDFRESYYASVPDVFDIEYGKDGITQIRLLGTDFLTVMNVVFFLYTDGILDVWHQARSSPENAARYRQVRLEIMKFATHLGLPMLERAARLMVEPQKSLKTDMAHAINHPSFFNDADVVVELNGDAVKVHSQVVCQRCPFFDALFHGRSAGGWIASRRKNPADKIHVDLKHIEPFTFDFVLRYLYADTEEKLFDQVRTKSLDELIDLLLDIMYVSNELMIDRLSQICQKVLGRFVHTRNISYLLNSVAPIFVSEFKEASLEYICLNLEAMLANRYLEELDEDLLQKLDMVCHENQLACYPVSRGRNSEDYVLEKYPELVSSVGIDKQRRIDAMTLQSRLSEVESYDFRPRGPAIDKINASPLARKSKGSVSRDTESSVNSPLLKPKQSTNDLMFQMDDEAVLSPGDSIKGKATIRGLGIDSRSYPDSPALGASIPEGASPGDGGFFDERMSSPGDGLLAESPTEARAIAMHKKRAMASPPELGSAPWGSSVTLNGKKDLKDIMGETSQSRVSNLTLEMENRRETSGNFNARLSQKERKKMQQQQMQEKLAAQQKETAAPKNPWQLPPPAAPTTPVKDPLPGQSGPSTPASEPSKGAQKPAMTLRQTVAGTPPAHSKPMATPLKTQNRSVSGNAAPKPSPSYPPTSSPQTLPKASPQPVIQSIRHIPRQDPNMRSPSGGSLSLATILLQQQSEKDEIREAATAKHNLQEIQAEQEFQQWWDQESRRVQSLLEVEPTQQPAGGKGGRGGKAPGAAGSSRKRRGNKNTGPDAGPQGQKHTPPSSASSTPKKNVNANSSAPVPLQGSVAGNHSFGAGGGKNARRGGHGNQRGRGKERG